MNFDYWTKVYNSSVAGSDTAIGAVQAMAEFASTFNEWRNVFFRAPSNSSIEMAALSNMTLLAESFGEWMNVYRVSARGSESQMAALAKLMELAENPKDADWTKSKESLRLSRWTTVFKLSQTGSEVGDLAVKRLWNC